jgi:hypothetical protein
MEILDGQTDKASLLRLTAEAVGLLASGNFDALASRFGYALAYGRDRSTAIREDLLSHLEELGCCALAPANNPADASVKYFKPNDTGLLAAVDCLVPTDNGSKVLVSLVVTSRGAEKYFTLEGFAAAA